MGVRPGTLSEFNWRGSYAYFGNHVKVSLSLCAGRHRFSTV
jgi:hypothetical protein